MGQPPEAETNHEVVAFGDASNDRRLTMEHCGIDLASKTSAVCVMKPDGRIVREGMVPTDEDGFRTCLGRCESMQVVIQSPGRVDCTGGGVAGSRGGGD